jgi:hypothetical protein
MNPIKTITDNAVRALEALDVQVSGVKSEFGRLFSELSKYQAINFQEVQSFLKEPWCILPKSREEWWVVIPRWVGTQVGWLERATDTYNIFIVNRYSHMLGGIPTSFGEAPASEPIKATVENGELLTSEDHPGDAGASREAGRARPLDGEDRARVRVDRGTHPTRLAALRDAAGAGAGPQPRDDARRAARGASGLRARGVG